MNEDVHRALCALPVNSWFAAEQLRQWLGRGSRLDVLDEMVHSGLLEQATAQRPSYRLTDAGRAEQRKQREQRWRRCG